MKATIMKNCPKETTLDVPASKSIVHRSLICASLAKGKSVLHDYMENDDIIATKEALMHFGVTFNQKDTDLEIEGIGGKLQYDHEEIHCKESGSTLRFLIPIVALMEEEVSFVGEGRLLRRPQNVYEKIFHEQGLTFSTSPFAIKVAGKLKPAHFEVKGNVSSQFISGLLFVLPLLEGDSEIEILPPIESESYIHLTITALKKAGIEVEWQDNLIKVKGHQEYQPFTDTMPGDDSGAAFFAVCSQLLEVPITIENMEHNSKQGDHVIVDIIKEFGGIVEEKEKGYRFLPGKLKGSTVDLKDCPDLGPILFVLASCAEGTTTFLHTERLRIKESDRIEAMEKAFKKLNLEMQVDQDTVQISKGQMKKENVVLDGYRDHRIVMALSVLLASSETKHCLLDVESAKKSFPGFFTRLEKVGVSIDYDI